MSTSAPPDIDGGDGPGLARARSTCRRREALVAAVMGSGMVAAADTAASFGVSWWLVQRAFDSAALTLRDFDALAPRMLGINEHRYRSVRLFHTRGLRRGNATNPDDHRRWPLGRFWRSWTAATVKVSGTGCSPARFGGAWARMLFRSTRQLPSARPCGCSCHAPLFR
jgi:hypothetical protein